MSDLLTFRLSLPARGLADLWRDTFVSEIGSIGLALDRAGPAPAAVTSADGADLKWFETGRAAWDWLRCNDGLMTFWAAKDVTISMLVCWGLCDSHAATDASAEVRVIADLPWTAQRQGERQVRVAEALARLVFERCDGIAGCAWDENWWESLLDAGLVDADSAPGSGSLLGWWNALPASAVDLVAQQELERRGACLDRLGDRTTMKVSAWPWEVRMEDVMAARAIVLRSGAGR